MNDYFNTVTRDQLAHDIKETGMLDNKAPVENEQYTSATIVAKHNLQTLTRPSIRGARQGSDPFNFNGISGRRRKKRPSLQNRRNSNH